MEGDRSSTRHMLSDQRKPEPLLQQGCVSLVCGSIKIFETSWININKDGKEQREQNTSPWYARSGYHTEIRVNSPAARNQLLASRVSGQSGHYLPHPRYHTGASCLPDAL
ncbi:hypothetical protein RRG08_008135 [Elysia crispata]|uniref:Uncharacterized protein n=1 Tax=Elysia crispata TaxID=231223 RepID=A0AAE1DA56_9GAST|nr:hypothetical protein RRG08_008135 [Elysia crispata]